MARGVWRGVGTVQQGYSLGHLGQAIEASERRAQREEERKAREQEKLDRWKENQDKHTQKEQRKAERDYQEAKKAWEKHVREMEREAEKDVEMSIRERRMKADAEAGRMKVSVNNSVQMLMRNIERDLDTMVRQYTKSSTPEYIKDTVRQLKADVEPLVEKALGDIKEYMVTVERDKVIKYKEPVVQAITDAENIVGYVMSDAERNALLKELFTGLIQGRFTERALYSQAVRKIETLANRQ
jgi:hypothetical protein